MTYKPTPKFIWVLFQQLRRRHFPLSLDDYAALKKAMEAGFGWSSKDSLKYLCCSLWAKSRDESQAISFLFDQLDAPDWTLTDLNMPNKEATYLEESGKFTQLAESELEESESNDLSALVVESHTSEDGSQDSSLPPIFLDKTELPDKQFIFLPHFPLSQREIGQAWRRFRQLSCDGSRLDVDIDATIRQRCELGVVTPVVLVPRQSNVARLLILIDSQGSMDPFEPYIEHICTAIIALGGQLQISCFYFHDLPAEGTDESVLEQISYQLFPKLDSVIDKIPPITMGYLYREPNLEQPIMMDEVLKTYGSESAVIIISDAGAARQNYDLLRLLDTAAFLKTLRQFAANYVWLNPLPVKQWKNSTAEQISRHAPMFPIDKLGLYQAVNVLSGLCFQPEKPI